MFASAYLTLTSIIQGVALAALVQRVESNYPAFDLTSWLLTAATFLVVFSIWHEYLMMIMGYTWVPNLLDSIVPFAFLAAELFMTHFVFHDLRNWLLSYGALLLVGLAAWLLTSVQARSSSAQNQEMIAATRSQVRLRVPVIAGVMVLTFGCWALYSAAGLQRAQPVIASLVLLSIVLYLGSSVPYWNRVGSRAASS